ncbi:alpha/beta fold hydrolase [Actinomadura kijaniata]|uniref:alpha/beta fold hydrolase n=1 Tax=Actinomadura kijaniata TaxID=46161 RepID=UPI003F1C092C
MSTDITSRAPRRRIGALLAVALLAGASLAAVPTPANASRPPACVQGEAPKSPGHAAATGEDAAFNRHFRHCFTTIDGVQMHYVIGGNGPGTTVLLHGWPQSWYEFRSLLPRLRPGRTLIAIDLPGMGDSTGTPPDMRKTTLARYVHRLLNRLGHRSGVQVVAHDFGVGVAYALAARYRRQTAGLFLMDFPLVGRKLTFDKVKTLSWHFAFNLEEPLAEQLVTGRVGTFLGYFYPDHSHVPQPVPAAAVREFTRVYSRPQVLRAGFGLYRTWALDEAENIRLQADPLRIPVRLLTQDGYAGLMFPPVRQAAPRATVAEVKGAGHWLPEERPELVANEIDRFQAHART